MTAIDPEEMHAPGDEEVGGATASVPAAESAEGAAMGARLDEHHLPETNGWMAVCRRCGMRTDGPNGRHAPPDRQLDDAASWLESASLATGIARLRERHDT